MESTFCNCHILITLIFNVHYFPLLRPNFDLRYQIQYIFMVVFFGLAYSPPIYLLTCVSHFIVRYFLISSFLSANAYVLLYKGKHRIVWNHCAWNCNYPFMTQNRVIWFLKEHINFLSLHFQEIKVAQTS